MGTELKPCPFCGFSGGIHKKKVRHSYKYDVECNECWASTGWCWNVNEAIEVWNRMEKPEESEDA